MGNPDWLLSSFLLVGQAIVAEGTRVFGNRTISKLVGLVFSLGHTSLYNWELAPDSGCWVLCAKISQQNNTSEFHRANTQSQLWFPDIVKD